MTVQFGRPAASIVTIANRNLPEGHDPAEVEAAQLWLARVREEFACSVELSLGRHPPPGTFAIGLQWADPDGGNLFNFASGAGYGELVEKLEECAARVREWARESVEGIVPSLAAPDAMLAWLAGRPWDPRHPHAMAEIQRRACV